MAAPLSGIAGQQQQIPASNTFRPGTEQQVRQQEERRQTGDTTQTSDTQSVERSQNIGQTQQAEVSRDVQAENVGQRRGSVLDITV